MSPFRNLHFKLGDAMNVIKHLVKIFTTVMIRYRLVFCSTVHIYVSSFNGFYRWFDHIGFKRPFYEILILNQIQLTYSSPYYSFSWSIFYDINENMSKSQTAYRLLLLGKIEIRKFLEPCTIFQYYYPVSFMSVAIFFNILFLNASCLF